MIHIKVDKNKCKGCSLCVMFCPRENMELSGGLNQKGIRYVKVKDLKACTGCGVCFLMCPDAAIEIRKE